MESRLTWERTKGAVLVRGRLDDRAELESLRDQLQSGDVLDLAGVTEVSSAGVRTWLDFLAGVASAGHRLVLARCSIRFVNQLNLIRGFSGTARIASILAPYVCPSCATSSARLIEVAGRAIQTQVSGPIPCPVCATPMAFDDVPVAYFSFLEEILSTPDAATGEP